MTDENEVDISDEILGTNKLKSLKRNKEKELMAYIKEKYEKSLQYSEKRESLYGHAWNRETLKEGEVPFDEIMKFLDGTKHTNPYSWKLYMLLKDKDIGKIQEKFHNYFKEDPKINMEPMHTEENVNRNYVDDQGVDNVDFSLPDNLSKFRDSLKIVHHSDLHLDDSIDDTIVWADKKNSITGKIIEKGDPTIEKKKYTDEEITDRVKNSEAYKKLLDDIDRNIDYFSKKPVKYPIVTLNGDMIDVGEDSYEIAIDLFMKAVNKYHQIDRVKIIFNKGNHDVSNWKDTELYTNEMFNRKNETLEAYWKTKCLESSIEWSDNSYITLEEDGNEDGKRQQMQLYFTPDSLFEGVHSTPILYDIDQQTLPWDDLTEEEYNKLKNNEPIGFKKQQDRLKELKKQREGLEGSGVFIISHQENPGSFVDKLSKNLGTDFIAEMVGHHHGGDFYGNKTLRKAAEKFVGDKTMKHKNWGSLESMFSSISKPYFYKTAGFHKTTNSNTGSNFDTYIAPGGTKDGWGDKMNNALESIGARKAMVGHMINFTDGYSKKYDLIERQTKAMRRVRKGLQKTAGF